MTYAAPIEIVQAALSRVGAAPITSLSDGSMPAKIANANYEGIARRRLSEGWSFASYPVQLTYQGERGVGRLRFAYMLPAESLRVLWVGKGRNRLGEFFIDDGAILVGAQDEYEARIAVRADEANWSPDFSEAFVKELEGLFLRSLRREPDAARVREADAEEAFRNAMAADKRQFTGAPTRVYSRFVDAWRGV